MGGKRWVGCGAVPQPLLRMRVIQPPVSTAANAFRQFNTVSFGTVVSAPRSLLPQRHCISCMCFDPPLLLPSLLLPSLLLPSLLQRRSSSAGRS